MNFAPPRTLLIFDLDHTRFGLDAALVRESIWLPELIPFEAAPLHIDGIFSLRGRIIPVADLNLCFGHPARRHLLSDQIVILELNQLLMGLIVSEVVEVVEISAEAIQPPPELDGERHRYAHLLAGEVRVGDDIVMLLDASRLMYQPHDLAETDMEKISPARLFCPEATPEEHAVFRARAQALMQVASEEEGACLPLAVVEIGGEYFGIELQAVQEFCDIIQPSPIPCCPPHILGAVCLRGNLLTLLDIRAALNLPRAQQSNCKAIVALLGDQRVGVAVDQVHDVIYLREDELLTVPSALREQHGSEIKGTASYGGKMMAVLNLPVLLAREEWVVNEIA